MHDLAFVLAYMGAFLGVVVVVPQLARTIRHPQLTGVSPTAWALTASGSLAWLTYGVRAEIAPQIPGNVLLAAGAIAIVLLVPSSFSQWRRAALLVVGLAAVLAACLVVPPAVAGFIGFGFGLIGSWPQLADSIGTWRRAEVSGVSIPSMSIRLASGTLWLTYALLAHDTPTLVGACLGVSTTVVILGLETTARSRVERRRAAEFAMAS